MAAIGRVDSQQKCSTCKNRGQKALRKRRRWADDYLFLCHRLWCGAFVLSTRVGKIWHLTWSAWASRTPSCPPERHPCYCPSAGLWRSVPGEVAPLKILSDSAGLSWVERVIWSYVMWQFQILLKIWLHSFWGNQTHQQTLPWPTTLNELWPTMNYGLPRAMVYWAVADKYIQVFYPLGTKMTLRISSKKKKKKGEPIAALLAISISASPFPFLLFRTPQSLPSHPLRYLCSQN